jgi:hypothetical protein
MLEFLRRTVKWQNWSAIWDLLVLCASFAIGYGFGLYLISPDGVYGEYVFLPLSHDWHQYRFSLFSGEGAGVLLVMGSLNALVWFFLVLVPVTVLFLLVRLIAGRKLAVLSKVPLYKLILFVLLVSFVCGVVHTLIEGRTPGVL